MKRQPGSKVTIRDVATEAGVSTSTVSFVLNNRPGISEEKKRTVLAVAKRLNYLPDKAAQALSSKSLQHIGLSDAFEGRRFGPFATLYREHLFKELTLRGFRPEDLPTRRDGLPERVSDLVVLVGLLDDDLRLRYLREQEVPFVVLGHAEDDDVRWVSPDNIGGGRQATEHLLRLGHKDILFLSRNTRASSAWAGGAKTFSLSQVSFERFQGYQAALKAAGLEVDTDLVLESDFTTLEAYRTVAKALKRGVTFSALFAITDELAVGAIAALEDAGLNVPGDVSVVGFDDLPEIGEMLTTIRQDIPALAEATVELVQEALAGKAPRHLELPVQLIVRGTTARKR